jgi:hypothetical protein
MLLGAGWSTTGAKARTGTDALALALLDRMNSPSFHTVSKAELETCAIDKIPRTTVPQAKRLESLGTALVRLAHHKLPPSLR